MALNSKNKFFRLSVPLKLFFYHKIYEIMQQVIKEEEEDCFFIKNSLLGLFFLSEKRNCRCCFGKPSTMGAIQESLMFLCGSEEEEGGEKLHQVHE